MSTFPSLIRTVFLPNDAIAPARAMRIRKAREWGAHWVRDWEEGASHIIVDNTLNYGDILKYLKITAIPVSRSILSKAS